MCKSCRERVRKIPHEFITSIDVHRTDIIEVMTRINNDANPEDMRIARETYSDHDEQEYKYGLVFSPYVVGFLIGQMEGINAENAENCLSLMMQGIHDGSAVICAMRDR